MSFNSLKSPTSRDLYQTDWCSHGYLCFRSPHGSTPGLERAVIRYMPQGPDSADRTNPHTVPSALRVMRPEPSLKPHGSTPGLERAEQINATRTRLG
ncbi:hypothetical protein V6N11_078454 [Hibiscus sabdariffa]|uniref:Uncharacterized protein n=1 Tax=Hibiscus sabdariffa TaxID=183260 RepID=A0ABR2TG44_9ROSI